MNFPPKSSDLATSRPTPEDFLPKHRPPTHRNTAFSPLFPALRSGPTAAPGAARQKQTPGSKTSWGSHLIQTPHLDSIAKNGVRFTPGYVAGPNCSPSRAGLLTGRTPTRFGYEFFSFTHEGHYFVPPPYNGVTTLLRRKTLPGGAKGLWMGQGGLHYHDIMGNDEPDYDANNPIVRCGQPVVETANLTDAFTREAVDFIDRHDDKPFFLHLAYNAVHSPLQGADAYMEKFAHIEDLQRRIFAAMLANMDDSVGSVLAQLRKSGIEENTLVFFLSDNGGPTKELTSSNLPLRGGKGQMYEGALRVPFMMQWKGKVPAGLVYGKPVNSFDIFATAAANGDGVTAPKQVEGVDLIPYLTGKDDGVPHETLFWRQGHKRALRHGDWKLVHMGRKRGPGQPKWELYNLAKDLSEERDLAATQPDRLAELVAIWENLNGEMSKPLFP